MRHRHGRLGHLDLGGYWTRNQYFQASMHPGKVKSSRSQRSNTSYLDHRWWEAPSTSEWVKRHAVSDVWLGSMDTPSELAKKQHLWYWICPRSNGEKYANLPDYGRCLATLQRVDSVMSWRQCFGDGFLRSIWISPSASQKIVLQHLMTSNTGTGLAALALRLALKSSTKQSGIFR
jgi:hypothetical protein